MKQPARLYVITSPRPRMGKTLLARLMMEYFQQSGRPLVGFDLNPREPMLAGRFPKLVWPVDITEAERLVAALSSPPPIRPLCSALCARSGARI